MNVLATTESDLILRIRRSLARRMGAGSRLLAALLLSAACAVTLPSCGTRDKSTDADSAGVVGAEVSSEVLKSQTVAAGEEAIRAEPSDDGEVDWAAVRSTPPDVWSEELKAQIVAAGHDVQVIAERVRQGQSAATRDAATPGLDDIGRRIRAAVAAGEMTPEQGRARYQAARESLADDGGRDGTDRLREFRRSVAERAMAVPPEEWDDELKAAIVRAGWDLDEFTEGIRQRQAAANDRTDQTSGR